jgi:starch synthase (maltosyl-transferring)
MNERILIEAVSPSVDGGRYPAKCIAGQSLVVEADIVRDGHDVLRAVVKWRRKGERRFREAPMTLLVNDRWRGTFQPEETARHEFTVEAWHDPYATWLEDLRRRVAVGEPIASEVHEGIAQLEALQAGAKGTAGKVIAKAVQGLRDWGARQGSVGIAALTLAEEPALLAALAQVAPRNQRTELSPCLELIVDRPRALYSTWYEMFPRSQGNEPGRHATFAEAARRLPEIRDMGFDVVYLPPIHPVGETHRKGRNNALAAEDGDPGSPWAIGSRWGGHTAIEPQLGTLEDFHRFVTTAETLGMEVALDFAIQCSPDHPWVHEHPEWFYHRPDGTIKYAENPPKKYQDVYPLNFDLEDTEPLWEEMLSLLRFWIGHGVKIFRVDNPHTKPLPFWEWLIVQVQREHPEVLFLSEAFTRPKMMKALAKVGFTQSYTYFTWRNHKWELSEYLTELTTTEMAAYFRPNFFTNTPDILHDYLQTGGRAAFKVRLVLAATLSPSYGIYSGFELCENEAVPGTEEYLNSEKYAIKVRDWHAPGNLNEYIARVNAIRAENPALQRLTGLRFLEADDDRMLCYAKSDPAQRNVLIVAVNLDPHHARQCTVRVPPELVAEALPGGDGAAGWTAHDLLTGARFSWGGQNFVRLDPEVESAHILRVEKPSP